MILPLLALALAILGLILLGIAGPVYRLGAELTTAFTLLRWGAYVGAAGAALGLVAALYAHWRMKRIASLVGFVALVAGAIAAGIPYMWQQRAQSVPRIHDITTDLDNPPTFDAIAQLRASAPNSLERPPMLASQQREGYPDIQPLTLSVPTDQAFRRALAVAQDMGWEIVTSNESAGTIEATDTTRWFAFKDDVVVRVTPWGSGARVDVRSVSRVGLSDVGTNARRIREFLDRLREDS